MDIVHINDKIKIRTNALCVCRSVCARDRGGPSIACSHFSVKNDVRLKTGGRVGGKLSTGLCLLLWGFGIRVWAVRKAGMNI